MKRTYNIVLEKTQIEYIIAVLMEMPAKEVIPLILELGKQLKEQERDGDK